MATTLPRAGDRGGGDDFTAVEFRARGRNFGGVDFQAAQDAVDLGAAADALDDFLAQVAAFIEAHGLKLAGFLNEKPLGNFLAVARAAIFEADDGGFVGCGGDGAGVFEILDEVRLIGDGGEKEKSAGAGGIDSGDGAFAAGGGRVWDLRDRRAELR